MKLKSIFRCNMLCSYFFLWNVCVLCVCFLLELSQSNQTDSREVVGNNSREQIQPLILHLNKSAAEDLIQEANRKFVSNTSFDDIISDNDTLQMLLRYRERQRQIRLKSIQHDILLQLGFDQEPNVSRMSEEQRMDLVSLYSNMSDLTENNDTEV